MSVRRCRRSLKAMCDFTKGNIRKWAFDKVDEFKKQKLRLLSAYDSFSALKSSTNEACNHLQS